jgi:hypothetical protein
MAWALLISDSTASMMNFITSEAIPHGDMFGTVLEAVASWGGIQARRRSLVYSTSCVQKRRSDQRCLFASDQYCASGGLVFDIRHPPIQ